MPEIVKHSSTINLGNKIHITDPCYPKGTWCGLWDLTAKAGKWVCIIEKDRGVGVVSKLTAHHEGFSDTLNRDHDEEHEIGVDAGMVGIFDAEIYPRGDNTGEYDDEKSFYGKVCRGMDNIGDRQGFLAIDGQGFISRSGHGDGAYTVFLWYVGKKVCGVSVKFI